MVRNWLVFVLILVVFFSGFSSVSASTPPTKIVSGVVSNVVSALVKWLWSLKSPTKTAVSSGSMVKFESGYTVETVFDGSKLGIEPYSVEMSPNGDLLVLDSENSNIYKISTPLSMYSRPKLVAGSAEGYYGHVDGRPREARMNHPKGITVDDRGNIYVADTINMAIRKISDTGVTTIAGGKWSRLGGHVDGPSEDAKFSNEFDVVYVGSSCSLLVIDRGNQAIREIQLNYVDCSSDQYDSSYHLGIFMLVAAGFFGYMLAMLQRRVRAMFSRQDDSKTSIKRGPSVAPYQRPYKSARPPLIPSEDDIQKPEEGLFGSIGRLVFNTGSSVAEICGGLFTGFRRKRGQHTELQQRNRPSNAWPMQESFVIPDEDEPPSLETRTPTPRNTYQYVTKQCRGYYNNGQQKQIQNLQHFSPNPNTYYEKSCETNEIVFGAVQEQDGRREAVVIKAVDYGDSVYSHQNIRPRLNYMGYSHAY
ncbi:hypothetical protein Ddye_000405 [Dipteronia dyeriana]|uniref:NHL repeat-containing protein n=1 Tax=Dipteronia dyeriana TaxID=168575 RepID=A0AAD9XLK8_9ROSI|nr:hypothetical protein Ddye_000405 [Dipteronia dyeriana]